MREVIKGVNRSVFIHPETLTDFEKWQRGLNRSEAASVARVIKSLADRSFAELVSAQNFWKYQRGTEPKVFAARIGSLRVYCCLKGNDIVVLEFARKQGQKADALILDRAQRRAAELELEE